MAGLMWGADGPNRLYGQDVSNLGVGWQQINGGSNVDPRIGAQNFAQGQTPGQYNALGFNGDVMIDRPYDPNQNADTIGGQVVNPAFLQWLQSKNYTPVSASDESGNHGALQDSSGQIVNGSQRNWGDGSDDAFGIAALLAGGAVGSAAAGAGGVAAGGAAGGGAAGAGDATLGFSLGGANGTIGGAGSQAAMFGQSLGAADAAAGLGGTGLTATGGGGALGGGLAAATGTGAGLSAGTGTGLLGAGLGDTLAGVGGSGLGLSATQLANYAGSAGSSTPTLSQLLSGANTAKGAIGGVGSALAGLGAAAVGASGSNNVGTPNYQGAATSMGQSARTNQNGPLGSVGYVQTGVDAQGNPIYSQNTSLSVPQQANLTAAQGAQGHALGALGQDQSAQIQQAQDAAYHKQTALLDPQYQQGQQALDSSLANQGIGIGSEAYNNATGNFARQKDYAYGNARDSSIAQGNAMQQQLYGQNYQTATGLGSTINSMGNPQFQAPPSSTNYLGAAALQGQGNLNQYNATTGANNSLTNGLFNLGGSVLSNPNWTGLIGNLWSNNGNTPAAKDGP